MVIDEITAITEADHYDIDAINTAYERYNTLTDKQKEMVTNYADLLRVQDDLKKAMKAELSNQEEASKKRSKKIIHLWWFRI